MNFLIRIKTAFPIIKISKEHLKDSTLPVMKYQPFSKLLISNVEEKSLKKNGVIFTFHLLPHSKKPMPSHVMEF